MENVTQEVQTPEEKATVVFEEVINPNNAPIYLGEGEEIVANYDFPTIYDSSERTHEVFLTTHRFVHVEKRINKKCSTKKINAFAIGEIDCVESVIARRRDVSWALVVLFALLGIAGAIVGYAVTPYAYAGCVFIIASILTAVLPREKRIFSLLLSGLSEHRETHEVISLGAVNFTAVDGDELESGDIDVVVSANMDELDRVISEIGAKVVEIKEGRV